MNNFSGLRARAIPETKRLRKGETAETTQVEMKIRVAYTTQNSHWLESMDPSIMIKSDK